MDPVRHGGALPGIHVRVCHEHGLELKPVDERSDELWCPAGGGHVAARWKVVDTRKQRAISSAVADNTRRGELTPIEDLREAHPIAVPRLTPQQARDARLMKVAFAPAPPAEEERTGPDPDYFEEGASMPVPKCSRCGGNGHNRRTCRNEPSAGVDAAPSAAPRARKAQRGGSGAVRNVPHVVRPGRRSR